MKSYAPAIGALVVCLVATAAVRVQLGRTIAAVDAARFESAANRLQDAIVDRVGMYVAMLRSGAAMIDTQPQFNLEQFRTFVRRLDIQSRYPGIQGVGFTQRLAPDEVAPLVAARRRSGDTDFRVWPESSRDEYHAILVLEPLDRRNLAAIGYDMFTEPTRRDAMSRARDTGVPAASGPVTLVQEIDEHKQPGFLIYMPVYAGGGTPTTIEERRAKLAGFVYSPFRIHDLFTGIFGSDIQPRAGFELVDPAANDMVLYASGTRAPDGPAPLTRNIVVAGRPWTASFFATPGLIGTSSAALLPMVTWGGIAFSIVIAGLVAGQTAARLRLERTDAQLQRAAVDNAQLYAQVQQLLESERAARSEAERASRLKDEFLAMLSHELRTPLNAIYGWAQLLATTPMDAEKRQKAVDTIFRNARMQLQLVGDLLDMSRIASGRERLELAPADLAELLDAAISVIRPDAERKGVTIRADVRRPAPPIDGDAKRLQQVFWNLLTNAVKFTPAGGEIHVRLSTDGSQAVVEVRDTGTGIPSEFLPVVFDRFRQRDGSIARQHGGLGLGLSIVKNLVQMHGGTVIAASDGLNRGATFTVSLPLAASSTPPSSPLPATTALPAAALAGARILAVDDEADARDLLRDLLGSYGAVVTPACSADEALAILAHDPAAVDLIISDISMPSIDGYELMRRIRRLDAARGGGLPAIALTAYASTLDRDRALAAGFTEHLTKPVMAYEVVTACARLVQPTDEASKAARPRG